MERSSNEPGTHAANEVAVELFLAGELDFVGIPVLIQRVLDQIPLERGDDLEIFLEADRRARELARKGAGKSR